MMDYKKNPRAHVVPKFLLSLLASFALLLVAFFVARAAWHMYGKFASASAAAEGSEAELARLQAQKADVNDAIEQLSSPRGVEEVLRERFGVAKPGEGEIRIVRKGEGDDTLSVEGDQNIFTRVFRALFVW